MPLAPGEAAVFSDGADYPWLIRTPDGTSRETAPAATAELDGIITDLRAMDRRRLDCAPGHAVDDAVTARAAAISARVSPGPLAPHVTAAMRRALAPGAWLGDPEEPQYLAPPYRSPRPVGRA